MGIAEVLRRRTFQFALRTITFCRQLPETWEGREIARQLLRTGMGTASNYWSACRGRSGAEFVAKLGVAADEAGESVMGLMLIVQSGIRHDADAKDLLAERREITAILSKSHKTARENRQSKRQLTKSPTNQLTNSTEGSP